MSDLGQRTPAQEEAHQAHRARQAALWARSDAHYRHLAEIADAMLDQVVAALLARYPQAPLPVRDEHYLEWEKTGRGCEMSVHVVDDDLVQVDYPGGFGGFDRFRVNDPALVCELASQLFPEEPLDRAVVNARTMKIAWVYPDPSQCYPHRLLNSVLLDPLVQQTFRRLYPEVVAAVGPVSTLWTPSPTPAPDPDTPTPLPTAPEHDWSGLGAWYAQVFSMAREFEHGETWVARWFETLRATQPDEYVRWAGMFEELPGGEGNMRVWDLRLLRELYRPPPAAELRQAWAQHPDPTVRRVAVFFSKLWSEPELPQQQQQQPASAPPQANSTTVPKQIVLPEFLTPAQLRAVTQRTGVSFLPASSAE